MVCQPTYALHVLRPVCTSNNEREAGAQRSSTGQVRQNNILMYIAKITTRGVIIRCRRYTNPPYTHRQSQVPAHLDYSQAHFEQLGEHRQRSLAVAATSLTRVVHGNA